MKKSILIIIALHLFSHAHTQLIKEWEFTLEGNGIHPYSYSISRGTPLKTFPTDDGDFITVSRTRDLENDGYIQLYLYRFSPQGDIAWTYAYESPYKIEEYLHDAAMDIDGNIIISAESTFEIIDPFESQLNANALLLKISPDGNLLWHYESPPPPANWAMEQSCTAIATDADGNIYAAMHLFDTINANMYIQKRNKHGQLIWEISMPFIYKPFLEVVDTTLVVIQPGNDAAIFHLDAPNGEIQYTHVIPKLGVKKPLFDQDGNWYSLHRTREYQLDKRGFNGDTLWSFYYPTNLPGNVSADEAVDIHLNPDGSLLMTGRHYGPHYGDTSQYSNCDILTIKLSPEGEMVWEHRYQFSDLRSCQVGEKIIANEKGFVFVGGYQSVRDGSDPYASSDMLILVYSPEGILIDSVFYNGHAGLEDNGVNLVLDDKALYLLGWSQQADSLFDQTVIKYENQYTVFTGHAGQSAIQVYPNPIQTGKLYVTGLDGQADLTLFDANGMSVLTTTSTSSIASITLPMDICPGWYYLQVRGEKFYSAVPVIILED